MTSKTRKLTCTTPQGVFTRTTHRTYTHIVVAQRDVNDPNGNSLNPFVYGWCGRLDLAENQARSALSHGLINVNIYPVDAEAPAGWDKVETSVEVSS